MLVGILLLYTVAVFQNMSFKIMKDCMLTVNGAIKDGMKDEFDPYLQQQQQQQQPPIQV